MFTISFFYLILSMNLSLLRFLISVSAFRKFAMVDAISVGRNQEVIKKIDKKSLIISQSQFQLVLRNLILTQNYRRFHLKIIRPALVEKYTDSSKVEAKFFTTPIWDLY